MYKKLLLSTLFALVATAICHAASGVLVEPNHTTGNWNNEYKVRLYQQFAVGDKLIIDAEGEQMKVKFADAKGNDNEIVVWEDYNEGNSAKKHEITATADNLDYLNNGGIIVQGKNLTIKSLSYDGAGDVVEGTRLFDGQEPPRDLATVDLRSSLADFSLIEAGWKDCATISEPDEKGNVTLNFSEAWKGVGVKAAGMKADENGKLIIDSYLTPTAEPEVEPLNAFQKWGTLTVSMANPHPGTQVTVYYRDINIAELSDPDRETTVETINQLTQASFDEGQTTLTINLDNYRYIRAISIKSSDAGTVIIKELKLTERESYTGNEHTLWQSPDHQGLFLGDKSYFGETDDLDWSRKDENGVTAWVNVQTIDCSQINTKYPYFVVVYKDGYTDPGNNGVDRQAPAQIQAYLNLPCYDIDNFGDDRDYWKNREWTYQNGENSVTTKVVQRPNNHERSENVLVPVVAAPHTFHADSEYNGSYYSQVPEWKHGSYQFAEVYVDGSQTIPYPVKEETAPEAIASRADGDDATPGMAQGNKLELLKKYGLAVRGQNVTLMKIVYNGDVRDNDVEIEVPDDIQKDPTTTGIETVGTDTDAAPAFVDVYNLQGMRVRHAVEPASATAGLRPGIYIVNGKKVWVK